MSEQQPASTDDPRNAAFEIKSYNLPDAALADSTGTGNNCLVWQPQRTLVVIGKGSDPALEVSLDNVLRDRIPVLRRATGGCAVVLSPDMLVGSFALRTEEQLPSRECFRLFLQIIMGALRIQGIRDLGHQGISDIAIGERKIAGTAIYRNRQLVFFHAILNVAGGTEAMEKYLLRPPRMPDYRRNRSHHDFVTSLTAQGYSLDSRRFANDVKMEFIRRFGAHTSLASEAA